MAKTSLPFSINYLSNELALTCEITSDFQSIRLLKSDLIPFDKKKLGHTSSGLLGVVDKYGCVKNNRHLIVKASPSHLKEMADIEKLSNQIFDLFDINMATYGVTNMGKKRLFISENFLDDYLVPATPKHLSSFFKECEGYNVRNIIALLKEKVGDHEKSINEFLRLTIIDSFIGNYDRHPGNLMLIYINGEYELSPAYDNISILALRYKDEFADLNYGGRISTQKNTRPMLNEYLEEFVDLSFYQFLKTECERYFSREKVIISLIKKSKIHKETKAVLQKLVNENFTYLRECHEKVKSLV